MRLRSLLRWSVFVVAVTAVAVAIRPASQAQEPRVARSLDPDTVYILPFWSPLASAADDVIRREAENLRRRVGPEGRYVRLGFSGYVFVSMDRWDVDHRDTATLRSALAPTARSIDAFVDRAHRVGIPVALAILTPIRERTDPVQRASEQEDVRSMQWYADNSVASGWWTHSRYATRPRRLQEAYVREVAKILANRMHRYPEALVAAAGDGEVELAYPKKLPGQPPLLADYSPFTIAEFRDWLRHGGLYATGGTYEGQGYEQGRRYAGDASPAEDTNGDGHTLNGDFGTSFTSWKLLHFDWTFDGSGAAEQAGGALPHTTYVSPAFKRLPGDVRGGFDAPRVARTDASDRWWNVWVLFKQTLLQHHNTDFARWVTTSSDPETGATVPTDRWYSYQIPSDYAFNGTPENPTERFVSSMSAWWTGDVAPYGSIGITAFNLDWSQHDPPAPSTFTLRHVAPRIAERGLRWGIIEWNPGLLPFDRGVTTNLQVYRDEMALIERYRPSLLKPFAWGDSINRVENSGFEVALKELVARINDPAPSRLTINRDALRVGMTRGGVSTPPQVVQVAQTGWARVPWTVTSDQPWLTITPASGFGPGRLTVRADPSRWRSGGEGAATATVTISGGPGRSSVTMTVAATLYDNGKTGPPIGHVGAPASGVTGLDGIVPVSGWALDDVAVAHVRIYRACLPLDARQTCTELHGRSLVLLGEAQLLDDVRPDVVAAFPTLPQAYRAGWGFLLNAADLPDVPAGRARGGRGTFEVHVLATDVEGNQTFLGQSKPGEPITIGVGKPNAAPPVP